MFLISASQCRNSTLHAEFLCWFVWVLFICHGSIWGPSVWALSAVSLYSSFIACTSRTSYECYCIACSIKSDSSVSISHFPANLKKASPFHALAGFLSLSECLGSLCRMSGAAFPSPAAEMAEMNRLQYEMEYTEGISQRMRVPEKLKVAPQNADLDKGNQEGFPNASVTMQVPERIVVAGMSAAQCRGKLKLVPQLAGWKTYILRCHFLKNNL